MRPNSLPSRVTERRAKGSSECDHKHGLHVSARGRGLPHRVSRLARREPHRRDTRGASWSMEPGADGLERLRTWNRLLADARYAAIAWPEEWGGRGAGLMEQVVFAEEMQRAERTGNPQSDRPLQHRSRDHRARIRRAETHAAPPHAPRRRHLVSGLLGARRRLRPRVATNHGRARRRLLDRERSEDVEHARAHGQLV